MKEKSTIFVVRKHLCGRHPNSTHNVGEEGGRPADGGGGRQWRCIKGFVIHPQACRECGACVLRASCVLRPACARRADTDTANPKPCAEKKKKTTTTSGPGDTILNPTTGRFVLRSGAIGTKILLAKAERVLNGLADSESESEVACSSEGESESESAGAPSRKRKKQKCENVNLLPELLSKKPKPARDARFREVEVSEKSPYGKVEKKKRVKKLWQRAM